MKWLDFLLLITTIIIIIIIISVRFAWEWRMNTMMNHWNYWWYILCICFICELEEKLMCSFFFRYISFIAAKRALCLFL